MLRRRSLPSGLAPHPTTPARTGVVKLVLLVSRHHAHCGCAGRYGRQSQHRSLPHAQTRGWMGHGRGGRHRSKICLEGLLRDSCTAASTPASSYAVVFTSAAIFVADFSSLLFLLLYPSVCDLLLCCRRSSSFPPDSPSGTASAVPCHATVPQREMSWPQSRLFCHINICLLRHVGVVSRHAPAPVLSPWWR